MLSLRSSYSPIHCPALRSPAKVALPIFIRRGCFPPMQRKAEVSRGDAPASPLTSKTAKCNTTPVVAPRIGSPEKSSIFPSQSDRWQCHPETTLSLVGTTAETLSRAVEAASAETTGSRGFQRRCTTGPRTSQAEVPCFASAPDAAADVGRYTRDHDDD